MTLTSEYFLKTRGRFGQQEESKSEEATLISGYFLKTGGRFGQQEESKSEEATLTLE